MELKDFIKNTLIQINEGVTEAQKKDKTNAIINPSLISNGYIDLNLGKISVQTIELEAEISITSNSDSGGGIQVAGFGLNVKGSRKENNATNRVKIPIPVALPVSDNLEKDEKDEKKGKRPWGTSSVS